MKTFANSVSILLLGGSLVALLLVNFAMLLGIGSINDASGGFFIGILFSQAALIAVLMAWAPLPLGVRMVLGISILIWCVVCLAAAFVHADVPTESLWMAILPAAVWIANCIPLVYMRLTMGTRISCNEEVPGYEGQYQHQFGIRQLMIAISIIAVLLAVSRALLSLLDLESGRFAASAHALIVSAILFVYSVITSWVVICFCLGTRRIVLWAIPVMAFCAMTAALEIVTHSWGTGYTGTDAPLLFLLLQGSQFLGIAIPLLSLRAAGFRLVRRPRPHGELPRT